MRTLSILVVSLVTAASVPAQAARTRDTKPNWRLAEKFSSTALRKFVYSTAVRPQWIGKTDRFLYGYRTSAGTRYWLVDADARVKKPLFDHDLLAAKLSVALEQAFEANRLELRNMKADDTGRKLTFDAGGRRFEFELATAKLTNKGKAPRSRRPSRFARSRGRRGRRTERRRTERVRTGPGGYRSWSPDKRAYAYADKYDLWLVEPPVAVGAIVKKPVVVKPKGATGAKAAKRVGPTKPAWLEEKIAVRLTKGGVEDYSFGGSSGGKGRARVSWSKDSKAFYVSRRDSRGVAELYLVDSLGQPRPTLKKYKYPMPGEEHVRHSEFYVFSRAKKTLRRVTPKWKDESYSNIHWVGEGSELRFVRRDRLWRHLELCKVDPETGKTVTLITERVAKGNIAYQSVRYIEKRNEMLWWSERSGWGHYYLYDKQGKLKNRVTHGAFRASRIVAVDEDKGILWFRGNGREAGESIYNEHLYRVYLDGSGLAVLDGGDATHAATLSPSHNWIVDNASRVDLAPTSVLRDGRGNVVMQLERFDASRLEELGWRLPETFVVKAADGVTDLYGNMWKPFDFDATRSYPIIANVYPGPQQEGVTHRFSATNSRQELAQLGFIVIQVGHRGGTPGRSKAYHSYGYKNLRDYGLADKKAAIEQLASRYPFIDIERVGIYGHSGGGFMSAAAMLQKPYNRFFKVAVASSGNHDNNIYGNYWAERYHGMDEVEAEDAAKKGNEQSSRRGGRSARRRRRIEVPQGKSKQENRKQDKKTAARKKKFEIKVPTNAELAANLEGRLLLVHGELDNNVHPAGTMRLVDALIKANKRFDMLIIPGARHGYGSASGYFKQRLQEYFVEHLLGHRFEGADILDKRYP